MSFFDTIDFGTLQTMLFPVIKSIGGPDIQDVIAGKAEALHAVADGFSEIAGLFDVAAQASEDGIFTNEEINTIVAEAKDVGAAYEALRSALASVQDVG